METAAALRNSVYARLQENGSGKKSALMYLQEVRKLLCYEASWVQGHLARDVRSTPCKPCDVSACEFSLEGALEFVREELSPEWAKAKHLLKKQAGGDLQKWNDRWWRTHKGVLAVIDRAMAEAV